MFKKMFGNGARRIVLFTLALLAPCAQNTLFGQAHAAQNEIANPTCDNDPIKETTTPSGTNAADSWGPVPTKKASLANLAPYLLPYFNNGPVFGLPGTDSRDFRYRTQLAGTLLIWSSEQFEELDTRLS